MNLDPYRSSLAKQQARKEQLEARQFTLSQRLSELRQNQTDLTSAREFVTALAIAVQEEIKGLVEEIVTLALASVYGQGYSFSCDIRTLRGRPVWEFFVTKDKIRLSPKDDEVGGGVLDVASLGMRLVVWSLMRPGVKPLLLCDEPLKFCNDPDGVLVPKASAMLREISHMLGIQVIAVSSHGDLSVAADKVYQVRLEDGVSIVTELTTEK